MSPATPIVASTHRPRTTCNHHHPSLNEIYPNLFLGNLAAAESREKLTAHGITHVISVTSSRPNIPADLKIAKKFYELHDDHSGNLLEILPECVSRIEYILRAQKEEDAGTKQKKVLVHCCMGKSRSGAVVVGYVMKYMNCSLAKALEYVKGKRGIVRPNSHFMGQLKLWGEGGFSPWCVEELEVVKREKRRKEEEERIREGWVVVSSKSSLESTGRIEVL